MLARNRLFKQLAIAICVLLTLPAGVSATSGAYQRFEHGSIYSSELGTFAVFGKLDEKYRAEGATAKYGFPIAEHYQTKDKGDCQEFELGTLCESGFAERDTNKFEYEYINKNGYSVHVLLIPLYKDNYCAQTLIGLEKAKYKAKQLNELAEEDAGLSNSKRPVAAFNADLYSPNPDSPLGLNVKNGLKYKPLSLTDAYNSYWTMSISKDKFISYHTSNVAEGLPSDTTYNTVAGFATIYTDGKFISRGSDDDITGTITAAGELLRDGHRFVIAVIKQGKFLSGGGISRRQAVDLMKEYGELLSAMQFDSGGSPSVYFQYNGKTHFYNTYYPVISGLAFYEDSKCIN